MSETATPTAPNVATDDETIVSEPTFSDDYRLADESIVAQIRAEIDETAEKLRKALVTSRNAYAKIGNLFASLRENIVRPDGSPDWGGQSDRYRWMVGNVLDSLVVGLDKSEARRERQTIANSISYHTRKSVRSRVVALVQEQNKDADAETLTKLQEQALAKLENPNKATRQSPTKPASDSPEDIAAADEAGRTRVAKLAEMLPEVSVVVQAETALRVLSGLFEAVTSDAANEKGIVGREQAQSYVDRAYVVSAAVGKILANKATASDIDKARKAILSAPAESAS